MGQPAQFSTFIPRCPRNICLSHLRNTLETLPSTIPNIVEYMGRWGANALVPSAQFTKDEMWSQAAKVGPRCPNSSCGALLPWWPACPTLSFQTHLSLCLGAGGARGWQGWAGECPTGATALVTPQLCLTAVSTRAAWCPGCCLYCSWMPTLCYSAKESQPHSRGVPSSPTN